MNQNWQQERTAKFQVNQAFYNPQSQVVRDLGVLAAKAYRQEQGQLRVLDALAGCGVRSLRYLTESNADYVWVNEGNHEHSLTLQQNLATAIAAGCCQLTHQDAQRIFFQCYADQDYYDLVDVDCFGTATPYLGNMLWATKIGGLMYLTSTDGRTLTGHLPHNSVRAYGAIARSHPAAQEQALRLLIGATAQQAASKGLGIEPVFSLFTGKTYRLLMRLVAKPNLSDDNYGFLGYCHGCGNYQTFTWRKLNQISCTCSQPGITISGAMWLGDLHERSQVEYMLNLAQQLNWRQVIKLLQTMMGEIGLPPYFYLLGEIGRRGKTDIPRRSHLLEALRARGYPAAATHINPQAIKTDADLNTIIEVQKTLIFAKASFGGST